MNAPKILFIGPMPQVRARFKKFGKPYYPKSFNLYVQSLVDRMIQTFDNETIPEETPIKVEVCFYLRKTREAIKRKLDYPMTHRSGDVDNFLKAFLDCGQKARLFVDDRQVVTSIARKRYHAFGAIVCEVTEETDLYEFDSKWLDLGNPFQVREVFETAKELRATKKKERKNVS